MSDLTRFSLGAKGREYVDSCLQSGGRLSNAILQHAFTSGDIYALLPKGTSSEKVSQFLSGGITSPGPSYNYLADAIAELGRRDSEFLVVIEDPWAKSSDVRGSQVDPSLYFVNSNVCYLIKKTSFNRSELDRTIKKTSSFLFVGVVSEIKGEFLETQGQSLSNSTIDEIVAGCRMIFVSAYDREGLVIWQC